MLDIDSLIWFLGNGVATGSNLLSNSQDVHKNEKCKLKNKKEKKKTKVQKRDKRGKEEKTGKTKFKGFRQRFLSLFCCCFKSQDRNNKNGGMEQSKLKKNTAHYTEENTSKSLFVTIDLND